VSKSDGESDGRSGVFLTHIAGALASPPLLILTPHKGHSRHCALVAKCHTDQLLRHSFAHTWVSIETSYSRQTKETASEGDPESGTSGWVCCRSPGASCQHCSYILTVTLQVRKMRRALGLFALSPPNTSLFINTCSYL